MKNVEVVFALPHRCWRVPVRIEADATAAAIVTASGLDRVCNAQTGEWPSAIGLYGRKISGGHTVGDGERIELYRPLTADPREQRRRRAQTRHRTARTNDTDGSGYKP